MTAILDMIEAHSGSLCLLVLLVLCVLIISSSNKILKEIKFLFRRSEVLSVNDDLRHVPRNLETDYFNKPKE